MSAVKARVVNTEHSAGATLSILTELPDITYSFKRSDVGNASWSVPYSHPDLQRVSSLGPTGFGPKLTDFRIGVSATGDAGTWETVFGGFCGPVGLESVRSTVAVTGVDWLAWLDQLQRLPAYQNNLKTATDVASININPTQWELVTDILSHTWDAGNPDESVHITASFLPNLGAWSQTIIFHLAMVGDNKTSLDYIKEVGAYNEPYGFEFWMQHDKTLIMYAPRRTSYVSANSVQTFKPSLNNVVKISWQNTGPIAISTAGKSTALYDYDSYAPSRLVYRNWWQIKEYSNLNIKLDPTGRQLLAANDSVATHDRNPQHQLTLTFRPEDVATDGDALYWFRNQLGKVITVDSEEMFMPYHKINGKFWIDQQTLTNDNVGNWTCELKLEQIYQTTAT